jgi:hypothetical protein
MRAIDRAKEKQAELQAQIASRVRVDIPPADAPWPTSLAHRRSLVDLVVARVELLPATKPSRLGFDPERVRIEPR